MKGYSSIIYTTESELSPGVFSYPLNSEKQFFDLLLLGKLQAASKVYNEMIQNAVLYSYDDIIRFFTQFALSANSFVTKLNATANTEIDFEFYKFNNFLSKAETIGEINSMFELLFKEICDALEPGKEDKNNVLISSINSYIEKNYYDPNISIQTVADHLDKSISYVGRLYKKYSGVSIPDYINELRLKKSMELLSGSTSRIEEICKIIGFPNEKYFYLFFKKHVGITPNEYRNRKSG